MTALGRATIIAGFLAAVAIANAAVPTGSFIRRPVKGVNDLIAHAKSDPVVMDRFTRHFRMTPDQVTAYFKTLHLAKIEKDGVYLVFNVRPDKIIRGRHFNLKKGTLVFADSNGRPILKKVCANPMWMGMPPLLSETPVARSVSTREGELADVTSSEELVVMEPNVMAVSPAHVVGGPIIPPATRGVSISTGGGGFSLLPLLLLGAAGSSTLFHNDKDSGAPPVPEPATLIIAGSGFAAIVARRRNKKN